MTGRGKTARNDSGGRAAPQSVLPLQVKALRPGQIPYPPLPQALQHAVDIAPAAAPPGPGGLLEGVAQQLPPSAVKPAVKPAVRPAALLHESGEHPRPVKLRGPPVGKAAEKLLRPAG